MRSRITAAGRMSPQSKIASRGRSACALASPWLAERAHNPRLPAAGGVHAHSHHRGWQNEPTIQGCQPREECMHTHITAAGRTSQQSKIASHGRSACALTSPRLAEQANNPRLPATGGVHAHSHHHGWQNEPTIQDCQPREECMRTHITAAGRTSQRLPATGGVHAHSHHRGW